MAGNTVGPGSYETKQMSELQKGAATVIFKTVDREKHHTNILQKKGDAGGKAVGPANYLGKGPFLKKSFNVSLPPAKFN